MKTLHYFAIIGLSLLLSACTWVNLAPEAEQVVVAKEAEVKHCKYLGKSTVSVKADVASFARGKEKVQLELEILARNEAAKVKGDTIVPITDVEKGRQRYSVYKCR